MNAGSKIKKSSHFSGRIFFYIFPYGQKKQNML